MHNSEKQKGVRRCREGPKSGMCSCIRTGRSARATATGTCSNFIVRSAVSGFGATAGLAIGEKLGGCSGTVANDCLAVNTSLPAGQLLMVTSCKGKSRWCLLWRSSRVAMADRRGRNASSGTWSIGGCECVRDHWSRLSQGWGSPSGFWRHVSENFAERRAC